MKLIIFTMLISLNVLAADVCQNPFNSIGNSYTLVSPEYCGPQDMYTYTLQGANAGLYVSCIDNGKVLNLLDGSEMVEYSNPVAGPNWGTQLVTSGCSGKVNFGIETTAHACHGELCSYLIYDNNSLEIGEVPISANQANQLTVYARNSTTVLASAIRQLIPSSNPDCATTQWTVQQNALLPPSAMAFLLAYKDSASYTCPNTPSPPVIVSNSNTGAIIAAVVVCSAAVVTSIAMIGSYYRKKLFPKDRQLIEDLGQ